MSWLSKLLGEADTETRAWWDKTDAEADAMAGGQYPVSLRWKPQPDITTYELALLTPNVARGAMGLTTRDTAIADGAWWDALDPSLRRHFVVVADRRRP